VGGRRHVQQSPNESGGPADFVGLRVVQQSGAQGVALVN
jgi:hypothetical protein